MDDATLERVRRWLTKAENDLETARRSLGTEPAITDTACFHAQQCAEKSLKAFIAFHGEHTPKSHDLSELLAICVKYAMDFMTLQDHANCLNDYAVTTRYPDDWREIPIEEAEAAVKSASEILNFVRGKIVD